MTEEFVTKSILNYLMENQWNIICFDFPQSGTGKMIHPNSTAHKNAAGIIPDIICSKNDTCLFFENKSFFYKDDFIKQNEIKVKGMYSDGISKLLKRFHIKHIYYGIGYPISCSEKTDNETFKLVDFVYGVSQEGEVTIIKHY